MARRKKLVYDTNMVAHLWANKSQEQARNPHGNLFFENETIYSYGYHFAVAKHVTNKRGECAVLITTRTRSVTTAGHISLVWGAAVNLQRFFVSNVELESENTRKSQFADYKDRLTALGCKYLKARQNKPCILSDMESLVVEANSFAKFFGLRSRLKMPADTGERQKECSKIEKQRAERHNREFAKQEIEWKERVAKEVERLERWVAGEGCIGYGFDYSIPVKLRIKGDNVETSRGAEVPLGHAIEVFRIARCCKEHSLPYAFNGRTVHVGHFTLNSIDANGNIRVGCHNIAWEELERVAKLAGIA